MDKQIIVKLNIMLLNDDCTLNNRDTYINEYNENNVIHEYDRPDECFFYKNGNRNNIPRWVIELESKILSTSISKHFACTSSEGLSIIKQVNYKSKNYLFAINFGQGRYSIKNDKIDETFGFYTAIGLIEQGANIRKAGTRNVSSNPRNTVFQNAQDLSQNEFYSELDDNDIVRDLYAVSSSESISSVVGKYGPLNIKMRFSSVEIPCWDYLDKRLTALIDIYNSTINNVKLVNSYFKGIRPLSKTEQNDLNVYLADYLQKNKSDFFLFEPEIDYDPTIVSKIKYKLHDSGEEDNQTEMKLDFYFSLRNNISFDDLIKDKIILLDEEGKKYKEWSIIQCLYGEVKKEDDVFVLSNKTWYKVPKDKIDRINKNIEEITERYYISKSVIENTEKNISLKKELKEKTIPKERLFNTELSCFLSGILFDEIKKQIRVDGTPMEVCDVFDHVKKEFIHTKIGTQAGKLSHLFNQGYVSGRAFATMPELFINKVNDKLVAEEFKFIQKEFSHRGYTVRFLILNEKVDNKLTFISKLALDKTITDLKGFGFNVKLSWINNINLNPN